MQAPGELISEGRFNGGFFCVTGLGGLYLEGLIHGGAYFRNFTVFKDGLNTNRDIAYSSNAQRPYLNFRLGTHMCIAPFSSLLSG